LDRTWHVVSFHLLETLLGVLEELFVVMVGQVAIWVGSNALPCVLFDSFDVFDGSVWWVKDRGLAHPHRTFL